MNTKVLHRAFGALAFLISLFTYWQTVQPSVPFWDCGEFTAAAVPQQVPHPPGAPLFLIAGKIFEMIIPFGEPAFKVNLVSVVATAISVLLLYLIIVLTLNHLREKKPETFEEAIAVFGAAFVGALAFNFSDTLWFNGVESEVYASSTFMVALIVWLMMRWNEEADTPGHERYLLLIAYMIGLSTGVHLLSILTVFSIAMVVYFRKYEFSIKGFFIMGMIAVAGFIVIYPGIVKWFPALLGGDSPFKNDAREHLIENSPALILLAVGLLAGAVYGMWYGLKRNRDVVALVCSSFLLIILGYSTYAHILVRANANPPMNENTPNTLNKLVSYLGREQYGDAPTWPRRYQTEDYFVREHKKYGEWYAPTYKRADRRDGNSVSLPVFDKVNTAGELNYLWSYQINHMYIRYFLWNFVGRASDTQDSPAAWPLSTPKSVESFNYKSGYASLFPINFYALPLIFGLIGLFFHFKRDWRMASVYMAMFLVMGVLAAIQQNQQNPQPRERDYFYVGSFMVFCLWIGVGVFALIENLYRERIRQIGAIGIVAASLVLVPLNMAKGGWKMHSRAGNYLPFDYAYNILQSVDKDAIVFTNGDNDTFPVWYLQDVAGVRRDVRIVNLSLGNTLWYIDQLKNQEPWGAKKIPLTFSDASLRVDDETNPEALSYDFGEARNVSIPVSADIMKQYTNNPALIADGNMRWTFVGQPYSQREGKRIFVFRVQDKLVFDILKQVKFERPVYYSMSVGSDAYCGLEDYFRMEGMALRICPVPVSRGKGRQDFALQPEIMEKTIMNVVHGNQFFTEPHYGFKLRNLNNSGGYYDEVHRRLMISYRNIYTNYARHLYQEGNNPTRAVAVLDTMNSLISAVQFPMSFAEEFQIADLYSRAGGKKQAEEFARLAVASSERLIKNPTLMDAEPYSRYYSPFVVASDSYELIGDFDSAINTLRDFLATAPGDPSIQARIDQLELGKFESKGDFKSALAIAERLAAQYQSSNNRTMQQLLTGVNEKVNELRKKLGMPIATKDTAQK